ncbi:hypothetical protein Tco_0564949 [Tanacetum coccineum]
MSTTEAESVSLSACCAQVIWMRTRLLDYGYKCNRIPMYYDSKSAIAISCNPVQHSHTKHIDIQYHFIKEHVEKGTVELYFVGTEYQLADLFTKALPKERFEYLVHRIEFIMAQPQRQADVHQDELCPPNKRYALMDANKKMDLDNPLCPNESKILANIIQNHPLKFSIAASSSVPWIYLGQFWHTLKEHGSKYRLSFMHYFRTIFQLPQATDNNHKHFVAAPKFLEMVPFYINDLGFTLELRSLSNFKTTSLVQPWQTLCNMFSRCLTTRVTGLHYSIEPPSTLIPYPIFIKLIVSYYMTAFPKISRRARDKYHNLEDDMMVKNIFNSRKHKDGVGMKILSWMIIDEMKLTENYQMYVVVFVVDVPTTQSQPIESTQGMHRTTSAPRSPNPAVDEGESTKPNVQKVKEHLITEEIKKLVEGAENVENDEVDSTTLRQNDHPNDPGTRLEPWSNKESMEVELTTEVQPVNINKEEEELAGG